MTLDILFSDTDRRWAEWRDPLEAALAARGIEARLHRDASDPGAVDYIVYSPGSPLTDFTPFTRLRAVLSTWAGVDTVVRNPTLTAPIARMSDAGLKEGMVEYVTGHVLRYHLGTDAHMAATHWREGVVPKLARERSVGILGFGTLGQAVGAALAALNFRVTGWRRGEKRVAFARTLSGEDGLARILRESEILVALLPETPETRDLLDARRLALCAGAYLINAGRGSAVVEADLLDALEAGRIAGATLDVFREEPLPGGHPFWAHPRITITPHVAAETRPGTAAELIAENVARHERGETLLHLASREAGY